MRIVSSSKLQVELYIHLEITHQLHALIIKQHEYQYDAHFISVVFYQQLLVVQNLLQKMLIFRSRCIHPYKRGPLELMPTFCTVLLFGIQAEILHREVQWDKQQSPVLFILLFYPFLQFKSNEMRIYVGLKGLIVFGL